MWLNVSHSYLKVQYVRSLVYNTEKIIKTINTEIAMCQSKAPVLAL